MARRVVPHQTDPTEPTDWHRQQVEEMLAGDIMRNGEQTKALLWEIKRLREAGDGGGEVNEEMPYEGSPLQRIRQLQAERDAYKRDAISARETQLIDERRAIEALRDGDALAAQLAECQRNLGLTQVAFQDALQEWGECKTERDAATALAGELRQALEVVANKDKDGLYRYCQHCHGFTSVAAGWKTGEHLPVGHVSDCPVGAALALTPPEALQRQQEREAGLAALVGELQAFLLAFWTETRPVENGRIYLSERNWNGWYERAERLWEQEPPEALQRQQERERRWQAIEDAARAMCQAVIDEGCRAYLAPQHDALRAALAERGGEATR